VDQFTCLQAANYRFPTIEPMKACSLARKATL
jgi:hypothetical protein